MNPQNLPQSFFDALDSLRNSPVVDDGYYASTGSLCKAIATIAVDAAELAEEFKMSIGSNRPRPEHYLEMIMERGWQIQSISEVIEERLRHEDFTKMGNVVYDYAQAKDKEG